MPEDVHAELLDKLERVRLECQEAARSHAFQRPNAHTKQATGHFSRQDSDRRHKRLQTRARPAQAQRIGAALSGITSAAQGPSHTLPAPAPGEVVDEGTFPKLKAKGKKRTHVREGLQRPICGMFNLHCMLQQFKVYSGLQTTLGPCRLLAGL